jgi:TPR repeat protein
MSRMVAGAVGLVALGVSACGGASPLGAVNQGSVPYEGRNAARTAAAGDPTEVAAKPCKFGDVDRCLERCQAGDSHACNGLGVLFEYGAPSGPTPDSAMASGFYARACDADYAPGCTNLAWLYSLGRGVPRDPQQAMILFTRAFDASKTACRRGDGHGCLMAGEFLLEGKIAPPDEDGALAFFQAACDHGEPRGCDYVNTLR